MSDSFQADRRRLLKLLAAGAAAPLVLRYGVALGGQDTPFVLGVASGDPWPDGFVIWTRLSSLPLYPGNQERLPQSVPVHWEVAEDPQFRRLVQRGRTQALRLSAHAVNVEVHGLQPGREYWYRFIALGEVSPVGRALTVPRATDSVDSLRLAVASCANWELGYFSAYRHMAEENPDLILFLGDYIYEYTRDAASPDVIRSYVAPEAYDLDGYRYRYALHRSDPDLQQAHAVAPWIVTWDDHEVQDDYSAQWSKLPGVSRKQFSRRRTAAYQAFIENMPMRRPRRDAQGQPVIYRRFQYGDLASLPVLDGRQYRSRQPCADQPPFFGKGHVESQQCSDLFDAKRTMLGWEQERWLNQQLQSSNAHWTLITQNLLVGTLRILQPDNDLEHFWSDSWDGYQSARDRLLQSLQTYARNPVVLSGDYHSFWANELRRTPDSPVIAAELVGTSITSSGPNHESITSRRDDNPHIRFFDSRYRGYISIDLTRTHLDARFQRISDRADRQATLSTLSRHVIESGSPRLIQA